MPAADPVIGRVVADSYEIVEKLGEGGMGAVYSAIDLTLDRRLAVKVLLPEMANVPSVGERFVNEARAAATIRHVNVVDVLSVGTFTDGRRYFTMEFLVGEDLEAYCCRRGPIPCPVALAILAQACAGIQAAHDRNILHRDLKPSNLFIVTDPPLQPGAVKVLDFGLAKVGGSSLRTATHAVAGTPGYMAPEQAMGLAFADPRSDVFALACIAFRMVTGRHPWDFDTLSHTGGNPQAPADPRAFQSSVPEGWTTTLRNAMGLDPAKRAATPRDLAISLAATLTGGDAIVEQVAAELVSPCTRVTVRIVALTAPTTDDEAPGVTAPDVSKQSIPIVASITRAPTRLSERPWGWRAIAALALTLAAMTTVQMSRTSEHARPASATLNAISPRTFVADHAIQPPPRANAALRVDTAATANPSVVTMPSAPSLVARSATLPTAVPIQAAVPTPPATQGHQPVASTHHHAESHAVAKVATGVVFLSVTRTYANITIDGTDTGFTPLRTRLPVGTHHIEMSNPDLGDRDVFDLHVTLDAPTVVERDW